MEMKSFIAVQVLVITGMSGIASSYFPLNNNWNSQPPYNWNNNGNPVNQGVTSNQNAQDSPGIYPSNAYLNQPVQNLFLGSTNPQTYFPQNILQSPTSPVFGGPQSYTVNPGNTNQNNYPGFANYPQSNPQQFYRPNTAGSQTINQPGSQGFDNIQMNQGLNTNLENSQSQQYPSYSNIGTNTVYPNPNIVYSGSNTDVPQNGNFPAYSNQDPQIYNQQGQNSFNQYPVNAPQNFPNQQNNGYPQENLNNNPQPNDNLYPENKETSYDYENFPVDNQNFPINNQNFPVNNQNFPVNNQNFPVNNQNLPVNNQKLPVNNQNFLMNTQNFPVNNQNSIPNRPGWLSNNPYLSSNQNSNGNHQQGIEGGTLDDVLNSQVYNNKNPSNTNQGTPGNQDLPPSSVSAGQQKIQNANKWAANLPKDQQPFNILNSAAIEQNRDNPQFYAMTPKKPPINDIVTTSTETQAWVWPSK